MLGDLLKHFSDTLPGLGARAGLYESRALDKALLCTKLIIHFFCYCPLVFRHIAFIGTEGDDEIAHVVFLFHFVGPIVDAFELANK